MAIIMGPILSFRGEDKVKGEWTVSALFVSDVDPGMLHYGNNESREATQKTFLKEHKGRQVWRFDMLIKQSNQPTKVQYMLAGLQQKWEFWVPAKGINPHIAYASCNGFSDPKYMKTVKSRNALWTDMSERHNLAIDFLESGDGTGDLPFSLLLMGGDQVYADSIWQEKECKPIYDWVNKPQNDRIKLSFTKIMQERVEDFYFNLYCDRWSQEEPAQMLASIPTMMMWDDHDIFDGWGSYPDEVNNCAVYQGIFASARDNFRTFQMQLAEAERPSWLVGGDNNFSFAQIAGDMAFAVFDMRSERTNDCVMSKAAWGGFQEWLDNLGEDDAKHLFIMSSIPVVHMDFSKLESILNAIPGQQELEDDLRDHWHSHPHKIERLDMIRNLLSFSRAKKTRVTFLSGDVHVAAVGAIKSMREGTNSVKNSNVMNQLTSSAIVHPPPPGIAFGP